MRTRKTLAARMAAATLVAWSGTANATKIGSLPTPTIPNHSTEYNASFLAENVFDGNPATEYASLGQGVNTFMEFDFGCDVTVTGFLHHNRSLPAPILRKSILSPITIR